MKPLPDYNHYELQTMLATARWRNKPEQSEIEAELQRRGHKTAIAKIEHPVELGQYLDVAV